MSAQAVLSMMAPARPAATPRGPSGAGAAEFESLLATALAEDDAISSQQTDKAAAPTGEAAEDATGSGDGGTEAAALEAPATLPAVAPSPPVPAPGTGSGAPKDAEPQVLPGLETKGIEPLVLPGAPPAKDMEPQVLPGAATAKAAEPLVLPGTAAPKGSDPQVLPGVSPTKNARPQVQPGEDPMIAIAPPVTRDGDKVEEAPSAELGSTPTPLKPGPAPAQPTPPPLRALAERTSKALDEPSASSGSAPPTAEKGAAPTAGPAPTPADGPPKPAVAAAPLVTPLTDQTASPTETSPPGEPVAAPAEAPLPVRDHALSTLSRATVDATAQIAAQILRKLEGRSTRFEIALRPDELGRVDVKLDIDSEGRLAARLAFDNPAAATDLRGRADELRRQLEAAGFQLADDAFEFAERDSGSSAFDRGQDARHGQSRAFAAAARLNNEIDVAQPPKWLALSLSPSGVDMKV